MLPSVDKYAYSSSTATTGSSVASPAMSTVDSAGSALWQKEGAQNSIMFLYVRDHADEMIARMRQEEARVHYAAFKQVHGVCLYKRMIKPHPAGKEQLSRLGESQVSSFSSLVTGDEMGSVQFSDDLEFRGITHVPGNVDRVLELLASESARENYWVALNTFRDVKAAAVLSSARLQPHSLSTSSATSELEGTDMAFPRWSRKYMANTFSKHNSRVLDCCYAEYAMRRTETNREGHSCLRGFVYRRSVSEGALSNTSSVSSEPLAKARVQGAVRYYIRDWLFDVIETQDPLHCKLVMTCSIFVPPTSGREVVVTSLYFRKFCVKVMVGARRALTRLWKNHTAHTRVLSSLSWRLELRCCAVCLDSFSLLRKCYTCRSCEFGVCSKCCFKSYPSAMVSDFSPDMSCSGFSSSRSGARMQQRGNHKRECIVCAKFGPDRAPNALFGGEEMARNNCFSSSVASMSASTSRGFWGTSRRGTGTDTEHESLDQVHPELEVRSTAFISDVKHPLSRPNVGNVGNLRSASDPNIYQQSGEHIRACSPWHDVHASRSKLRTEPMNTIRCSRSSPGIVLLSDLEARTLSSSSHGASAKSSENLYVNLSTTLRANAVMPAKSLVGSSSAHAPQLQQRHDHAATANYSVLASTKPCARTRYREQESSASTEEDEDVYSEDDLANFTLELL